MNDKHIFVDSNILVYAHDIDAKQKHSIAQQKITYLWSNDIRPSISIQVLQECYVTFVRNSLPPKMAKDIVLSYLAWNVIDNDQTLLIKSMEIKERWQVSFWDASILAAAKQANAQVIWSEDFNHNQNYDGIRVINPFSE